MDTDGDGKADVVHLTDDAGNHLNAYLDNAGNVTLVEGDANHDGKVDTVAYAGEDGTTIVESDTDGDGHADLRSILDERGEVREVDTLDTHGNVTSATLDLNQDGTPDVKLIDTDHDGKFDTTVLDVDHDGVPDTVLSDTDGDGNADTVSYIYGGPDGATDPSAHDESHETYGTDSHTYDDHATHNDAHADLHGDASV